MVELFGRARILAGQAVLEVPGSSLTDVLATLADLHPELVGPVLEANGGLTPAYTINLNGTRFVRAPDTPLAEADHVLVISSLSGG